MPASPIEQIELADGTVFERRQSLWVYGRTRYANSKPRMMLVGGLSVGDFVNPSFPAGDLSRIKSIKVLPYKKGSKPCSDATE